MNDAPHPALLPAGLYDLLPPDSEIEAEATARLMGVLASHGYQRVEPPLVEFEETLLSGTGTATASDTFRLMDPISHRMVGVRADMTPQIARIAATRMSHLSVDLTLPTLVPAIVEAYGLAGPREAELRSALDHKDTAAVTALAGAAGPLLAELIAAAGVAPATHTALGRLDLPARARE